jgi:DNA (cytosine-5)-methyltransferase 1
MMYAFDRDVFPADVHCLRILNRLGIIKWEGERAELRADEAQAKIPIPLKRSLHVDLIQHGRAVCTATTPACDRCVLSDLCRHPDKRRSRVANPTVVDLCCGSGGYSWGFMQAGFDVVLGVDLCEASLDTFATNIPGAATLNLDITSRDGLTKIKEKLGRTTPTVVIAGTPCQGFSRAGPLLMASPTSCRQAGKGAWSPSRSRPKQSKCRRRTACRSKGQMWRRGNRSQLDVNW